MAQDDGRGGFEPKEAVAYLRRALFAEHRAEAEEVLAESQRDLVAAAALELLAKRTPGRPTIAQRRISGRSGPLLLIEIVNDDMPFLVDSVMGELRSHGHSMLLVMHPVIKVSRGPDGTMTRLSGPGDRNWGDGQQESLIVIAIDDPGDEAAAALVEALRVTLAQVRLAVTDWQGMLARFDQAIQALERNPPPIAPGLLAESLAFCRWLRDGQFTFLGCREYRLVERQGTVEQMRTEGSGLGILRDESVHVLNRGGDTVAMSPDLKAFLLGPQPLIIAKSDIVSHIHRRVPMDYVGLKTYSKDGGISGELRLVGLFTSQAYTQPARLIPFLRHKVEHVLSQSGFAAGGHASKALANVLETFPRDELFQIGEGQLLEWSRGIVDLELRPRVRVFVRPDRFDRYVSVLVYAQRDRFSTAVRERIAQALCQAYHGQLTAFTPFFPEGPLVRVHFIIACKPSTNPPVDVAALEREINDITRTWEDQLASAVAASGGLPAQVLPKYGEAFSAGYAETFSPQRAIEDIQRIERLSTDRPVAIDFYRADGGQANRVHAAVYRFDQPIPLSDRVPVLENLGFSVIDERSYRVHPQMKDGRREVALHDMMLQTLDGAGIDLAGVDTRMEDAYVAVARGEAENDPFNRLVLLAGADWREAWVLRAYGAYMRQLRSPFGPRYIAETLARHAGMARDLLELFHVRFDPARRVDAAEREQQSAAIRSRIEGALTGVQSLDEDRILRSYLNLIMATVRTSFYQQTPDGRPPATIAFKIDSKAIDGMPEPKPFREIWVYGPRVEGVHLRFAPIARGGIRWSDRAQDFRTEVLGLCKAQQVKNTVIVPAGAKGGFLPKQMPRGGSRDEMMKEGIAAYRIFISSLLDLTENLVDGKVVPPENVVRHDADDPYLVVAADKGTATFSDFANDLAIERGFWLGDAFASGGSSGYDHKKMAITARGAWECVKRHFREMDVDIQTTPFSVVGVGDMSGDVFGNGMLLSPVIRLMAAFDHRDIFIDPDPDTVRSFAERKRLFDLPRSSWQDYDKAAISQGGGVFSRSAKSVQLTPQIQALLGLTGASVTPTELMNAILKAKVDLLWFGGIGTYVRASGETDDQVGDRANDAIRITGSEVRARVIGEGANLGATQRGRIEFATAGGRINTDFIDNSAGVNSSDQEVNIKIAIAPAGQSGRLPAGERNAFLASMTDDVARACLVNNIEQSLAISLAERRASAETGYYIRLMNVLEGRGLLNRKLEALPSNAELRSREAAGGGLTRPDIAVLLSVSKIALDRDLLDSKLPDDPAFLPFLLDYFPKALRDRFEADIAGHRLRREIIATFVVNTMINSGGPAFPVRLSDETGQSIANVAQAFLAVRSFIELPRLWSEVHALGGKIPGQMQLELFARVQDAILEQTAGLLRHGRAESFEASVATNRATFDAIVAGFKGTITPRQANEHSELIARLAGAGVPEALATRLSILQQAGPVAAITRLAADTSRPVVEAAKAGAAAAEHLRVGELKERAGLLKLSDYYDRLAAGGALSILDDAARGIAREALAAGGDFDGWLGTSGARLAAAKAGLDEIVQSGELTVSRLSVAAARVRDVAAVRA